MEYRTLAEQRGAFSADVFGADSHLWQPSVVIYFWYRYSQVSKEGGFALTVGANASDD